MKKIELVTSKKQLKSFIDFPHKLYKDDPNYVPELFIAQRDLLTPGKHPFHENGKIQPFLAYDGDKIVGRIAAIINKNHNAHVNSNDGFWGFFDCINDSETAKLLFRSVEDWLKKEGVTKKIMGPMNPSTNDTCGLLVDGFQTPPKVMMTYNAPYYQQLVEENGYTKQIDILAYLFNRNTYDDSRMRRLHELMKKRTHDRNIVIRKINVKEFKNETRKLRETYNLAWDKNLDFTPMTKSEFEYGAKDMKMILNPDYCMVAEDGDKIVGFVLALPNINETLIKVKKGRLLPTGIFKLLSAKKNVKAIRIIMLGVIEGYRKAGIEMYFYSSIIDSAIKNNIQYVEASWILENNILMCKAIEDIGGKIDKRYRIFEKQL